MGPWSNAPFQKAAPEWKGTENGMTLAWHARGSGFDSRRVHYQSLFFCKRKGLGFIPKENKIGE